MSSSPPTLPNLAITGHDSSGLSVFTTLAPRVLSQNLAVLYSAGKLPINLSDAGDIKDHEKGDFGLVPTDGCRVLVFNIPAGGKDAAVSRIHRNLTIDIGILLAGSGEVPKSHGFYVSSSNLRNSSGGSS